MKLDDKYFINDNTEQLTIIKLIKRTVYFILANCRRIQYKATQSHVEEKMYNVSICAIFKNEAIYLREWLEFNYLVGVQHFYMYNNKSEDDFRTVLQPYIDKGWVTLVEWPHDHMQIESYKNCIEIFAKETKWLGFIDIDEFIVPKTTDNIYEFLKPFEKNTGSVKIYWKLFGTSGLVDRNPNRLVVEDFIVCWPKYCDVGKCFYNTAFDFDKESKHCNQLHHNFWANWKGKQIPPVNIFNKISIENINKAPHNDFPIQINHYFTKSYTEYVLKCAKGDVYFKINPHDEDYFYEHEMKCTSTDYSAYKYLVKLKKTMGQRNQ